MEVGACVWGGDDRNRKGVPEGLKLVASAGGLPCLECKREIFITEKGAGGGRVMVPRNVEQLPNGGRGV